VVDAVGEVVARREGMEALSAAVARVKGKHPARLLQAVGNLHVFPEAVKVGLSPIVEKGQPRRNELCDDLRKWKESIDWGKYEVLISKNVDNSFLL
jgi:hypothetical protein